MNIMTVTLRQRGQLTIPDEVREQFTWLKTNAVVAISVHGKDELLLTPYREIASDQPDWKTIWRKISMIRTFSGRRGNLSRFIATDRKNH